ncbi:synaptotagmin-15-like [Liolophura sinensis]|uniref:synaptotagmin-15-like n=1 Tax=Liolophura sinensis TaxID=3198878 RepID=UPI0031581802
MLKNVFSQLDPSVVHHGGVDSGRVELSLKFIASKSLLLLRVECCEDLRSRDIRSKACNPYVKLWLIPDTDHQGEKHTETSPLTCNPVYKELFAFKLSPELLQTTQIFLEVWDQDVNERDEFLGQSLVHLSDHDLDNGCYSTIKQCDLQGNLFFCESVASTNRNKVYLFFQRKINKKMFYKPSFIEISLFIMNIRSDIKFQMKSGTTNIVLDETFQCKVPSKDFSKRFILFEVIELSGTAEKSLGQVVVPLGEFEPEHPFCDKFPLEDLTNSDLFQEKLAQDPATQELRGALQAHAMVANPSFIFQKPKGNKIITLTARKAGSQARIRIQDGVPVY